MFCGTSERNYTHSSASSRRQRHTVSRNWRKKLPWRAVPRNCQLPTGQQILTACPSMPHQSRRTAARIRPGATSMRRCSLATSQRLRHTKACRARTSPHADAHLRSVRLSVPVLRTTDNDGCTNNATCSRVVSSTLVGRVPLVERVGCGSTHGEGVLTAYRPARRETYAR